MKKVSCLFLAVMLMLSAGFPRAIAACYVQCQRFDIWQKCYRSEADRSRGCICADENGDGFCDGCFDRLCDTNANEDGQSDAQNVCISNEQVICEDQDIIVRPHGGRRTHHGGGHKNCH